MLVVSHEFGHFIVAKKCGMRVDEFGFGFPPNIFSYKKGETKYSFNALPLGGYVKIFGQGGEENELKKAGISEEELKRSFLKKPKLARAAVLFAGIFANLILAWMLFSVGFMIGMPASDTPNAKLTVLEISKDSPAEIYGLKEGDKITSVNFENDRIADPTIDEFRNFNQDHKNQTVEVFFDRSGKVETTSLTVSENGTIGIGIEMVGYQKYSFFKSIYEGFKYTAKATYGTVLGLAQFLGNIFIGQGNFSDVSGPIGVAKMAGSAFNFGFANLISFVAIISISLAVLNLVPFPALDGGQLLFLLIETIKGSPIKQKVANIVNLSGFALLILLMIAVTYHDIIGLIRK